MPSTQMPHPAHETCTDTSADEPVASHPQPLDRCAIVARACRTMETADMPVSLGKLTHDYRAGGTRTCIQFAVGLCFLGAILVAESPRGICAILLGDDPDELVRDIQNRFPNAELTAGDETFEQRVAKVVGFVEAPGQGLGLPMDIRGTAFQERVWQALLAIPTGTTISYTELAQRIGSPGAVRAVASACGANHLAVAIPCHRVVRRDGSLAGYRWGVERKLSLLDRERSRTDDVCQVSAPRP